MTIEQAKQKLVRRYKYLYENAYFILAPYMYQQSDEEYQKMIDRDTKEYGRSLLREPMIYLKINALDIVNSMFEEFLLSNANIEDTELYKFVESKRDDKEYLGQVKKGLELIERKNVGRTVILKESLDIWKILNKTWDYISEQSGDLKNKENKLNVLDEYYRIARYQNNGKIYTSGRNLNLHDVSSVVVPLHERKPFRDKKDIGIIKNPFITVLAHAPRYEDNCSIFTESEKQQIYLEYHDELPCDLEMVCELEEEYIKTMIETRLYRPEHTEPCRENFIVKEEEIFVNPNDTLYRYYQLCPHCGYMVNIPKEILSDGIKQRIEDRCSKDDKLFRKMFLYSELFSLDRLSTTGQKKVLKK